MFVLQFFHGVLFNVVGFSGKPYQQPLSSRLAEFEQDILGPSELERLVRVFFFNSMVCYPERPEIGDRCGHDHDMTAIDMLRHCSMHVRGADPETTFIPWGGISGAGLGKSVSYISRPVPISDSSYFLPDTGVDDCML